MTGKDTGGGAGSASPSSPSGTGAGTGGGAGQGRAAPAAPAAVPPPPCAPSLRGLLLSRLLLPVAMRRRRATPISERISADRAAGPARPPAALAPRVREEDGPGGRRFVLSPPTGAAPAPWRILYFHGGGYLFDLIDPHWTLLAGLSAASGAEIAIPLYPLAPEAEVEQGLEAAEAAWHALAGAQGASRVVLCGDSAGGGLALSLACRLRDRGLPLPAALALIAPWLDVAAAGPDQRRLARRDAILTPGFLREAGTLWAGGRAVEAPSVSPLHAAPEGLPPTMIAVGDRDMLLSDARRWAAKSPATQLRVYSQMFHVFPAADIPEGRHALAALAGFCAAHAGG
ncbi:alpha/beta hydrolase fold domain-containing protein [Rhodovulum sp. DZ06]|uniref:alpha/beta hydrolase fold domain-containing protein n=1 Tax=Rhodovulum sp. DZ06 TaxID=3425126 RepID=UPI003D3297ED